MTIALPFTAVMPSQSASKFWRLPTKKYLDNMKAGWIGQIVGAWWGGTIGGKSKGGTFPVEKLPSFTEGLVKEALGQNDLDVGMACLRTLVRYGFDVSVQ